MHFIAPIPEGLCAVAAMLLIAIPAMIVNAAALDGIFRNLRAEFQNAYKSAAVTWMDIATRLPSSTGREDHRWFHRWPKMREWVGERTVRSLVAHGYNVPNRKFEATVQVLRDDIEDDILGIYGMQAKGAGVSAKEWPDKLVYEALENGESNKCHDEKAFFASDHPLQEGDAFSNIVAQALDVSTLAAARASFGAARTRLMKMQDEEGEPMGLMATLLVVPPALHDNAMVLSMSDKLGGDDPNPYKGIKVLCTPRLKSDTKWYVADTHGPLKPLIFQDRVQPQFDSLTDASSSDTVFLRDEFLFGVRARGAAAYGLPQCMVLGKP